MNKIARGIRSACLLLLAFLTGLLVSGVSGYLAVRAVVLTVGPIFWEGVAGYLPIFAAVLGGILALLSAAFCRNVAEQLSLGKILVGFGLGVGLSLVVGLWVVSGGAFTSSRAPRGISFWTVVVLMTTGGLAGMAGISIPDAHSWRFSLLRLFKVVTLIAIVLGLIMLLT